MDCREILVVGLNPAFQTTLHFQAFNPGQVNRAYRKAHSIGGKGQNFAIACEQYGEADKITILQFIGGRTGGYVQDYLCEKGIHQVTVSVDKPTRQCTTLLDGKTGEMTELIEPPGKISLEEKDALEKISQQLIQSPRLEGIALCGSLPGGVTGSTFSTIIQNKTPSTVVFLDACRDLDVMKTGLVDILKINSEEAISIANLGFVTDLVQVGEEILKQFQVKIVAITSGPNTAVLLQRNSKDLNIHVSTYELPNLSDLIREDSLDMIRDDSSSLSKSLPEAVGNPSYSTISGEKYPSKTAYPMLNPLGAGDTCSGIFFLEYLDTQDAITSFRYGLAAASASCLLIDCTSHFSKSTMKIIYDEITVKNFTKNY